MTNGLRQAKFLTDVFAVIYIDQPVSTGFSFGMDMVNSIQAAAPPIWTAFQLLFENPEFSKYESREWVPCHICCALASQDVYRFIFATESYGGYDILPLLVKNTLS